MGLKQLEAQAKADVRPGVTKLLEFCKRTGDRPSDVAFGIGPRINAVSRIHGDACFGVELLTSRDRQRAAELALAAELANTRRKDLQATVMRQAQAKLANLDLSTTHIIILSDPQWSPGVLGLVANQIAHEYGRPTILFQTETTASNGQPLMARGSARSTQHIDLYKLVNDQAHLLSSFGGHPFAAGMSLPVEHLAVFAEGLNRAVRSQVPNADLTRCPPLDIDLEVTVADLGQMLFRTLKRLEPYGMGNPIPRLLLRNVRIEDLWEDALKDRRGGKQRYYKLSTKLTDPNTGDTFPAHWWGHRRQDLPAAHYDLVVELDVNTYKKQYEARIVDVQPAIASPTMSASPTLTHWLVDHRDHLPESIAPPAVLNCPTDWADLVPYRQAPSLTLAYPPPAPIDPETVWQRLVGVAKYLARTGEARSLAMLQEKLTLSDRTLALSLQLLTQLGFTIKRLDDQIQMMAPTAPVSPNDYADVAYRFCTAIQEEQFRRQYFYEVSAVTMEQLLAGSEVTISETQVV